MKKVFCILFSVYFVSLLVIPCGDKEDCNEFKQTETSQTSHHEEHSDETCTPFCVCSCCAAHFLIRDLSPALNHLAVVKSIYTVHKEAEVTGVIIPIWQPPKLA